MRLVYVEDGGAYYANFPVLKAGMGDAVSVDGHRDFEVILTQIEKGNLADAYILDNEIAGKTKIEGAQVALLIKEKAREMGKNVLVISMLSSSPEFVRKIYGNDLEKHGVPILSKLIHAAMCFFYVGQCLKEGKTLEFFSWLKDFSITLPDESNFEAMNVQNKILALFYGDGANGALFDQNIIDFITMNKVEITQRLSLKEKQVLDTIYHLSENGKERIRY